MQGDYKGVSPHNLTQRDVTVIARNSTITQRNIEIGGYIGYFGFGKQKTDNLITSKQ